MSKNQRKKAKQKQRKEAAATMTTNEDLKMEEASSPRDEKIDLTYKSEFKEPAPVVSTTTTTESEAVKGSSQIDQDEAFQVDERPPVSHTTKEIV